MVLEKMIQNFILHQQQHEIPLKILWLKKGGDITIKERCLLAFWMDYYNDQLWCDIVMMDACQLLLG